MICNPCRQAADQRAPRTQHCDDPGCTCGHQVQRYGTTTTGGTEQCRAEFHDANQPSARCDLPTGHDNYHRDQSINGGWYWNDDIAMYPTTTEVVANDG